MYHLQRELVWFNMLYRHRQRMETVYSCILLFPCKTKTSVTLLFAAERYSAYHITALSITTALKKTNAPRRYVTHLF